MIIIFYIIVIRVVIVSLTDSFFTDISGTYVECQEFDVRVQVGLVNDSRCKYITGQHDHIRSVGNCLIHTGGSRLIRVALRFVIVKFDIVFFAPCFTGFVGHLVKTLVGDITGVGNHRNLHHIVCCIPLSVISAATACQQGHRQDTCQQECCCSFLHVSFSLLFRSSGKSFFSLQVAYVPLISVCSVYAHFTLSDRTCVLFSFIFL